VGVKRTGILVTLLALVLVFGFSVVSFAYSGGSGTEGDPYEIATTDDLIELSNNSGDWGAHFIQTADIIFNADETQVDWDNSGSPGPETGFSPIGNGSPGFTGSYDGSDEDGDYKIENLYINRPDEDYVGLFGYTSGATIENVQLTDVDIAGSFYVGGLVGHNMEGTVKHSSSIGDVEGTGNE